MVRIVHIASVHGSLKILGGAACTGRHTPSLFSVVIIVPILYLCLPNPRHVVTQYKSQSNRRRRLFSSSSILGTSFASFRIAYAPPHPSIPTSAVLDIMLLLVLFVHRSAHFQLLCLIRLVLLRNGVPCSSRDVMFVPCLYHLPRLNSFNGSRF